MCRCLFKLKEMKKLQKFQSFKEADQSQALEFYRNCTNKKKSGAFLKTLKGYIEIPYKPGLYRYQSFEEAIHHQFKEYIRQAVQKKFAC